ncbi:hypothetical protein ASE08_17890 [Rhizobacter sp. Root16D2]|nr:hypothetical protein ASC88_08010 [Rhizobacter sp. Root29]KRB24382.1 hypothetical protein ASE08_17890 [Rhizobacter sp. Root16D2]
MAALVLFGSLMPAARAGDGSTAELYDKAHSAETQSVFDFIRTRTLASRSNMIEGQHMGGPGDLSSAPQVFDMNTYRIASASPRRAYPRMIGARYDANLDAAHYVLEQAHVSQINARLLDASAIYHPIVSITATPPNPWDRNSGRSSSPKDKALSKLFLSNRAPDTPAGRFWDDIDTIADGLRTLSDAGIPVVFRPFAEVNTGEKYHEARWPRRVGRCAQVTPMAAPADARTANPRRCCRSTRGRPCPTTPWWGRASRRCC